MTNVLHVIPPVKFGGGESLLLELLIMGRNLGNQETVCCLYNSPEFESALNENRLTWFRLSKINLHSGPSRLRSKLYSLWLIMRMRRLLSIISTVNPDVIHAHGFPSIFLAVLAKLFYKENIKIVYTHHWVSSPKRRFEKFLFSAAFRNVNYITAVSSASLNSLLRDHPELRCKSEVVNNFASQVFFSVGHNRTKNKRIGNENLRFVNVARFAPFKNQISIVEAVNQLSSIERSDLKIIFIGDGDTLNDVKSRVQELSLTENFEFKGFVPHSKVSDFLALADVMIFPSHNEGSPIAIAEALAAGLPVLGLNQCLPVVEVAADAGFFVNQSRLSDGIRHFMKADLVEYSSKARSRAELFKPTEIKRRYLDIYKFVAAST